MPWDEVMGKWKEGSLKSSNGAPVKKQSQAVAIMLSEKEKADKGKKEYKSKRKASRAFEGLKKASPKKDDEGDGMHFKVRGNPIPFKEKK